MPLQFLTVKIDNGIMKMKIPKANEVGIFMKIFNTIMIIPIRVAPTKLPESAATHVLNENLYFIILKRTNMIMQLKRVNA